MKRVDLSEFIVHWTKGSHDEEAYDSLRSILTQRKIHGYGHAIKGGYPCICFTETPSDSFHKKFSRYRPFGVEIPKKWLFEKGGRPVIYQTAEEYDLLPDSMKWRHVRYEPHTNPPIDFTWEREWRINLPVLELDPEFCRVLVPSEEWAECLIDSHESDEIEKNFQSTAFGENWLDMTVDEFEFKYALIEV